MDAAVSHIVASPSDVRAIVATLERFGSAALAFARAADIRIVALAAHESYAASSPALARLAIDVDTWPLPPAGLFVVEERTVYLRSTSPMTVAHEFAHGLDCALGGGTYHSAGSADVLAAFAAARRWITPYASTRVDEYFAEAIRAYVGINDTTSPWPRVSRARLQRIDPRIATYVERLFATTFPRVAGSGNR